jgi:hypothetical protein
MVAAPVRLPNPGCEQFALPLAEIPVAQVLVEHCVGLDARAVAVAALPLELLVIDEGRSDAVKLRKVGVAAAPELGPARTVLAVCVASCGASVPLEVIGEPETLVLKIIPSPLIPTLVTVPGLVAPVETNMVRMSLTAEIAVAVVTTVAMGMAAVVNPVVLDAGTQLLPGSRYT